MKKIFKNLGFILLGTALTVPAIVTPLMLANKTSKGEYDDTIIMPSELYLNKKGQSVLASTITKQNAIEYILGIPTDDSYSMVEIQDVRLPSDKPDGGSVFITLKLSRKSDPNLYKTQTYLVSGFMYESENKFKNTKLAPTELAKTILPSYLTNPQISKTEIEKYVKNIPNFSNEKAEVSIEWTKADDEQGTLTLSLLYKKDSRTAKIEETVSGFKSLGEVWKEEIDKEFTKFKFKAKPSAINLLPSNVKNNEILTSYVHGFDEVILENDVKQEISNIQPNDDNGSISFDLTLSKGSVKKTQTYNVPGFKTKAMQDTEDVNNVFESLLKYQARTSSAAGLKYPDIVNADNISTYIINLPKKPTNGVKIEYTNFISNNQTGELGFDIKISKGNIVKVIPQRSIFGFFSDNIISYVVEEFKKTITKKSSDDFIHRTDPKVVDKYNFKNYYNYKTSNRYNINFVIENVEFISIKSLAYFRLSVRATSPFGLNKVITIDLPLGSLYLSGIYLQFPLEYSNARNHFGDSTWASYNWKSATERSVAPYRAQIYKKYDNMVSIVAIPGSGDIGNDFYIRKAVSPKFVNLVRDTENLINKEEFVKVLSNYQYGNIPNNLENPVGTNIYNKSGSRTVTRPKNYDDQWIWWSINRNQKGAENTSYIFFSFDTNGKYNFHWNSSTLYIDYYWSL